MLLRREFLMTAAVLARAAPTRKPNLVFMLARQWQAASLPPNLARLARQGIQFERCYTACPSSGPAQAALISGRFPHACGVTRDNVRLPPDQPSIAEQLNQAGYKSAFIGDWFSDGAAQPDLAIDLLKQNKQGPSCLMLALGAPLDANVGRIMRVLDEPHLAEDTIVVFTSCHGEMLGEPVEKSVRVPLLIRYPRLLPASRKNDFLMSSVDVMPTLLGLCGADIPDAVQGQDLSALIASGKGSRPESIYSEGKLGEPGEWRMVVRGLDKLVVDRDLNVTHLYNLGADPSEMENLARDPAQELRRDEMSALLKDWMRRTGDRMDPSGLKKR